MLVPAGGKQSIAHEPGLTTTYGRWVTLAPAKQGHARAAGQGWTRGGGDSSGRGAQPGPSLLRDGLVPPVLLPQELVQGCPARQEG